MAVLTHLIPLLLVVSCFVLQTLPAVQGHNGEQLVTEQEHDEVKMFMDSKGTNKRKVHKITICVNAYTCITK